jgi:hypothetical protein
MKNPKMQSVLTKILRNHNFIVLGVSILHLTIDILLSNIERISEDISKSGYQSKGG